MSNQYKPITMHGKKVNSRSMEYTKLGSSGLKVSKVILGAMSFGNRRDQMGWTIPEDEALPILKRAYDGGLRTWDTADVYSFGDSERIISAALRKYAIPRYSVVIMTKLYGGLPDDFSSLSGEEKFAQMTQNDGVMANRVGLSRKHIFDAVEASIERLGTFIDVLQIHRLDRETPKEEIMRALNDVVESGRVRYLGACSMAAWELQTLNNIAEKHGWHKFVSMQSYYSLLHREEEREMFPYCRDAGIGMIPWSPLARGLLTRPYSQTLEKPTVRQESDFFWTLLFGNITEADQAIINRVEELSQKKGCTMAQIVIGWSLMKGVNPILGLNSIGRVDEAIEAVGLAKEGLLSEEDVKLLEEKYVVKAPLQEGF